MSQVTKSDRKEIQRASLQGRMVDGQVISSSLVPAYVAPDRVIEKQEPSEVLTTCPRCSHYVGEYQYGWIKARDEQGREIMVPGRYGPQSFTAKLIPCPVCSPAVLDRIAKKKNRETLERAFGGSNIPLRFQNWTFETFPANGDQEAKETMFLFAHNQLREQRNVYLYGPKGYGKTGLAVAVAHEFMARGEQVLYMRASDYFQRVREQKYSKTLINGLQVDLMALSYTVRLFILDEWGLDKETHEQATNFHNLVEERRNDPRVFTIVTSNRSLASAKVHLKLPNLPDEDQPFAKTIERLEEDFKVVQITGQKQRGIR